jgi:hypothetical protein
MGSRPLVAFGNETNKLELQIQHYTRNMVDRSFGRRLRNRLLSGCSMMFTIRPRISKFSSVSVYRVYPVSIDNIYVLICKVQYSIQTRLCTIECL